MMLKMVGKGRKAVDASGLESIGFGSIRAQGDFGFWGRLAGSTDYSGP